MDAGALGCAGVVGALCLGSAWCLTGEVSHPRADALWRRLRSMAGRHPPPADGDGARGFGVRLSMGGGAGGTRQAERERLQSATRDMPTFLDIVTLGISAGLSFDASLELYCDRYDTPLAHMVSDAMLSWRMGVRGRGEALQELARDVGSPALTRFATAVSDALAFGTPLAEALERQAQVIRDEQRSEVEEEIERVPVKMLIPLGTLIVPAMLVSILGPLLGPALSMT